jgi:hypothetical protein
MWVHGHSVSIEHPERIASVWRAGFFARIIGRSAQSIWIHYAVPTPALVDDRPLRLEHALVRFRTTPSDAWIAAVHIFDGEVRIASHSPLHLNPGEWTTQLISSLSNPEIHSGVGVSIQVDFHARTSVSTDSWRIDFSSVGCNLLT